MKNKQLLKRELVEEKVFKYHRDNFIFHHQLIQSLLTLVPSS